jgi:hypothetical protein
MDSTITSLWVFCILQVYGFFVYENVANNWSKSYSELLAVLSDQEISKLLSIVLIPGWVIRHKVIV